MKTVGLDQLSSTGLIVMAFGVMLFCLAFAWLIEILVPDLSFGFALNTLFLLVFLWLGLYLFGKYVGPLRYNSAIKNVSIGVISSLVGMSFLCLIKSRPFSRG